MQTFKHFFSKQFILFICIGVCNTVSDLLVFNILIYFFGLGFVWAYPLYKAVSFIFASSQSYFLNKYITFKNHKNENKFTIFFVVTIISFLVNITVSWLIFVLLRYIALDPLIASNIAALSATVISAITNFLGYKYVVFKD